MQAERKRPTGITIIGILKIIAGILGFIGGIVLIASGPTVSQINENDTSDTMNTDGEISKFDRYLQIFGIISVPIGVANIIVGIGLLKGKGWAWIGAVMLSIISIIVTLVYLVILGGGGAARIGEITVSIIINGIILWYLYRPNVRSYFGRIKIQTP